MRIKYVLFFFMLNIALFGQNEELVFKLNDFKRVLTLKGTPLNLEEHLTTPTDISVVDNTILLDIAFERSFGITYDIDKKEVNSFGIIGNGPGEFIGPHNFTGKLGKANKFWVADITLGKFSEFDLDKAKGSQAYRPTKEIKLQEGSMCYDPVWVSNNMIACLNYTGNGRITILDANGKLVRYAGKLDPPAKDIVPKEVNAFAYDAQLVVKPDGKKLALANKFSDRIEIYDGEANLIRKLSGPEQFSPSYGLEFDEATGAGRFIPVIDTKIAYASITCSNQYIYCLYSGRTERRHPDEEFFSKDIFVFNWDGALVKRYQVDVFLTKIAIDPDSNLLYGLGAEIPEVYQYKVLD